MSDYDGIIIFVEFLLRHGKAATDVCKIRRKLGADFESCSYNYREPP